MTVAQEHAVRGTIKPTCDALGVSRATFYRRRHQPADAVQDNPRRTSHRRIDDQKRQEILDLLCSEPYADLSPYQVYAKLLDEGRYLCSVRTMYRILKENRAVRERRNQRRHPPRPKPRVVATGPNQVWTWDITKLPGPRRGICYCLYVILDLYSRRVVGWCVEPNESSRAAQRLVRHACDTQAVQPEKLTIHADRGAPMTSTGLYALFESLGVTGSHSRPRVSNDNPFSESQFKTIKYHHTYPGRFESEFEARQFFERFFDWYNHEHHHMGLALFTPDQVHSGKHRMIQPVRQAALDEAYANNPERFVNGPPQAHSLPEAVAINPEIKPEQTSTDQNPQPQDAAA